MYYLLEIAWISCIMGIFFLIIKKFIRQRRKCEPPIVSGNIIFGSALDFNKDASIFLRESKKKYGEIFTIRLINQYITIIMDPNCIEGMNAEKHFDFEPIQKQVNLNVFNFILRDPRTIVKETGKAIRGKRLQDSMKQFITNLHNACDNIKIDEESIDTIYPLQKFTVDTAFAAIFNSIFGNSIDHPFNSSMVFKNFDFFHKYFNYLWLGIPLRWFPKAGIALKNILTMPNSTELLARDDLSSYIRIAIEHMIKNGQSEADIKGHNLVYLHVNYVIIKVVFWILNNLIEDSNAMDALLKEIDSILTKKIVDENGDINLSIEDIESMEILNSIVHETCRMASGVFVVRYVTEDTWFTMNDGLKYLIRKGDRVAIYPPAIHKDPEIFKDPAVFKYDRFIDKNFYYNNNIIKHPVMTFGALCPGKKYATLQIKWYIITILTRFTLKKISPHCAKYDYSYHGHEILPPIADIPIKFCHKKSFPKLLFC